MHNIFSIKKKNITNIRYFIFMKHRGERAQITYLIYTTGTVNQYATIQLFEWFSIHI